MGLIAERALTRTGALNQSVKTEPLPAGVYWIDVYDNDANDANIATFHDWLTLHADSVELLREEEYNASAGWNIFETEPHRIWALFRVNSPTRWDQSQSLGWPSEGTAEMTSGDTIQKPKVEQPCNPLIEDCEAPSWVPWAVGGGVVVLGLIVWASIR